MRGFDAKTVGDLLFPDGRRPSLDSVAHGRNAWKFARASGANPDERYLSFYSYYSLDELRDLLSADVVDTAARIWS